MSTILAFLTLAQDAVHGAEHEETSKTPFYIVGGIAALYGFGIALFGLSKHDFPASKGAVRAVCALSALIVAAAMASSVVTA